MAERQEGKGRPGTGIRGAGSGADPTPGGAGRRGRATSGRASSGSRASAASVPAAHDPSLRTTSGPGWRARPEVAGLLLVGVLALLPRLWHLVEYARLPFFHALQMDARFHAEWARRLVEGDWQDPQVFFRAPFYPYLLAILQSVTGDLLWTARVFQLGAGIVTVLLAWRLAARILPERWALAAGVMAALSWVPVHYETELLLEPVLTLQTTLLLFLMLRAAPRAPRSWTLAGWGALAGLAAITRPNLLVFVPALPLYAAWLSGSGGDRRSFRLRLVRPLVFVAAGLAVPVLPVWLHNLRHGDGATVIAWQGGINLYIGNNAQANGWSAIAPGMRTDWQGSFEDAIRLAQERSAGSRPLRPSEVSSYWSGEALRFWREEPGRALALTGLKGVLFWSAPEIRNNEDPRFYRARLVSLRLLPFSFALLAPFALFGLGLLLRGGGRARLLAGFVVAWFVSILPFFVCSRYRLPLAPLLPILALVAIRWAAGAWRAGRFGRAGAAAATVALLFALLFPARAGVHAGGFYQSWNNLGDAWSELGRWPEAVSAYRRALAEYPLYPNSHNNLAVALERMGRPQEAERAYRDGLAAIPGHPALRRNLAILLAAQGRAGEAEEILRTVLRGQPTEWNAAIVLARLLDQRGEPAEARALLEAVLRDAPGIAVARIHLAQLLERAGDGAAARRLVEEGVRLDPGNPDLRRALAGSGRRD